VGILYGGHFDDGFAVFDVPDQGHTHFLGAILRWALANLSCMPILESLTSAVAEILKGNPQIVGSFSGPGPRLHFLLGVVLLSLI